MGAWGYGIYEDDDAADFVADLITHGDIALVNITLAQVAGGVGIDAPTASRALVAADVVAAATGHPSPSLSEELQQWLSSQSDAADLQSARDAVIAVLTDSELVDLWEGSTEYRKWRSGVLDLLHRLGGELPAASLKPVKPKSPGARRNHPGIPPIDARAWKIMQKYFWKNGWLPEASQGADVTPAEVAYARDAGFLAPDKDLTHEEVISWAIYAVAHTQAIQASNAFLASLSSRRLELRSALGSYAVGQRLSRHRFTRSRLASCAICGVYRADKYHFEFSVLNFERFKWGGVRHEHPDYIAFDLTEFAKLPPCLPTDEDLNIFRQIITIASSLPAKAGPSVLVKQLQGVFPTNPDECATLITILGFCGIMQPTKYPAFTDEYVRYECRNDLRESDWGYPISEWRGMDGVKLEALTAFFPQVTG